MAPRRAKPKEKMEEKQLKCKRKQMKWNLSVSVTFPNKSHTVMFCRVVILCPKGEKEGCNVKPVNG